MGFGNMVASLQFATVCPSLLLAIRTPANASPVASDLLRPFIFVLRIFWKETACEDGYQTALIVGKREHVRPRRSCAGVAHVTLDLQRKGERVTVVFQLRDART